MRSSSGCSITAAYLKSLPSNFDRALGLDPVELFGFVEDTQPSEMLSLVGRYGNDESAARSGFVKRLASEIDARGTVDVLRHGVVDLGVTVRLAFFKPAHRLTLELTRLFAANRVTVTRQLAYESASGKALDMVLLVNGLPTATVE